MKQISKRYKRKNTELFFDSFKHFKHNLSNLIGIELPTLYNFGAKKYLKLISTNYKSKYPDMRKIGLIEYNKPSDYTFTLTPEAETFVKNLHLNHNVYSKNNLREGRKNIDSLSPNVLINSFNDLHLLDSYKSEILKLILSYYDTADMLRPYLALLNFMRHYGILKLDKIILQNILAQTKENILLMRIDSEAFNTLDLTTQEELKRPISYIYNFLQTALIIDSDYNVIVDFKFIDRLQTEMNNIVFAEPTLIQNNSRPAREQRIFREKVLKAYNYKCAITGQSIFIDHRVLLEAAHIIPYKDGGSFSVSNGIALSYEMHKMFDNGLFGFVYDKDIVKIQLSCSSKIRDDNSLLQSIKNKIISLPQDKEQCPNSLALEYNLQKYLLK